MSIKILKYFNILTSSLEHEGSIYFTNKVYCATGNLGHGGVFFFNVPFQEVAFVQRTAEFL